MQYFKLPQEHFEAFYRSIEKWGTVYGPVKRGGIYSFEKINDPEDMSLNYTRTMIPPKKFLIKPRERVLKLKDGEWIEEWDEEKKVLFGVHSCDINALLILDKVYLSHPEDPLYRMRRENSIIIGISCMPDELCFCKSLGTDFAMHGFDLFLHELPDGWLIRIGSVRGHEIIWENRNLLQEPDEADLENFRNFEERRNKSFKKELNVQGLADLFDLAYDSDIWKKYEELCLGCGNCNMVCPTCKCYEICDLWTSPHEAERIRRYDSCFMETHGLVAGGHNFRATRLERFRNRYYCKSYFDPQAGFNCVGCGRCDEFCPAKIEHVKVLYEIARGRLCDVPILQRKIA
jgi:sulfhydrogenase subunit beta (sulfur reductase)